MKTTWGRWAALAVLAAVLAVGMSVLSSRPLIIESDADEPPAKDPPKDEFPFSPRPNRAREIHWRHWSADVFEEAKKSGKLVAICLTATWCMKCHEMDEGAFSDPRVIAMLNEKFICVRVDTDKHPAIRDRYLSPKGWPTTAFCAPSGEFLSKTWFTPADGFLEAAKAALDQWDKDHDTIQRRIDELHAAPPRRDPGRAAIGQIDAILKAIDGTLAADGSGWATGEFRFPLAQNIELYVWKAWDSKDTSWLDRASAGAAATLKLEDPVEFGYYRLAMKPDWSEPHYEKLLETNAAMLAGLVALWRATGDEKWGKAASRVVEWMDLTLAQPEGGWGASQDADPDYSKLDRAARSKTKHPHVDPSLYAGLNAQAASAHFAYAAASGDDAARARAVKALDRVFAELWKADGLWHGAEGGVDLLRDLLLLGEACLDAAQATGAPEWVKRAKDVSGRIAKLADVDGGLFDRPPDPKAPGQLGLAIRKSADNGRAAGFLMRLHHVTGDEVFRKAAEAALKATGGEPEKYPAWSAEYALGLAKFHRFPLHLVIVGPKAGLAPMVRAADRFWCPWKTVTVLESAGKTVEHAGLEYPPELAAYPCVADACGPPVADPAEFEEATKAFLERNR